MTLPCIETTNSLNKWGYGRCKVRRFGRTIYFTHILAWVEAHGRLPAPGMEICHTCHNTKCMRVEHLYEGTRQQNVDDSVRAGRTTNQHAKKDACPKCQGPYRQGRTQRWCPRCKLARERERKGSTVSTL